MSTTTAWRYVEETVRLLSARSPKLDQALRNAKKDRHLYVVLDDKGYQGAEGPVITPYKGRNKPDSQKQANKAHAQLRAPGERANAQLNSWRILRKLRCCPWRAGQLAKAIHVLQIREVA